MRLIAAITAMTRVRTAIRPRKTAERSFAGGSNQSIRLPRRRRRLTTPSINALPRSTCLVAEEPRWPQYAERISPLDRLLHQRSG